MSYLLRSRKGNTFWKRAIILVLIFISGAFVFSTFDGVIVRVLSPLWKGQNAFSRGVHNAYLWFGSKDNLAKENTALREKIASQEVELSQLRGTAEREAQLMAILGRVADERAVLAGVLVRPPETPYDVLLIDAGAREGVKVDVPVRLPEGPLIGRVTEVWNTSSKVVLYSAGGQKTNAILERNNVPVTIEGRGGGNFIIELPRDIAVEPGDRILSADAFGRLLAVVGSVDLSPTDSFKEVIASGPISIFALRFVIVIPQ